MTHIDPAKKILIDGVERWTVNSENRPIHPTQEGLFNFWRWFGDSKALDAIGRPLVAFHGTGADFSEFDTTKIGSVFGDDEEGIFFINNTSHMILKYGDGRSDVSEDSTSAGAYAKHAAKNYNGHANIMPVYLRLNNPLIIDSKDEGDRGFDGRCIVSWLEYVLGKQSTIQEAYQGNHDGIMVIDRSVELERNGADERLVVAFNPSQIKSAIGNSGLFSETSSLCDREPLFSAKLGSIDSLNKDQGEELELDGIRF